MSEADETAGGGGPRGDSGELAPLAEAFGELVKRLVGRSRIELSRAAERGRQRLELRQLQRDRDAFWIRLGKTSYRLVEAGEIDHPGLRKAMERIDQLEARIEAVREGLPDPAEE